MSDLERRAIVGEIRADAAQRRLEGYAAVFGQDAPIGHFTERIAPGAFRSTLAGGEDILCLVDHDETALLGRTRSGTLALAEDQRGLSFRVTLPDTALARDLLALAQRGDIGGASIGFSAPVDEWPASDRRVLRSVRLHEVSIVRAWPAYAGTSVMARSRGRPMSAARRRRLVESL